MEKMYSFHRYLLHACYVPGIVLALGENNIESTTLASMFYIGGSQSMFPGTATSPFAWKCVSHADSWVPPRPTESETLEVGSRPFQVNLMHATV